MLLVTLVIICAMPIGIAAEDISSLVKQVMPGVVLIQTYDSNGNALGQGSGFVIGKDGDIVTCYHVMRGYSKATVTTSDEKKFQVRNVTALNKSDDLARISLSAVDYNFTNLSLNTTTPDVGQEVIAIGGPLGLEKTVSQGIVSAIRNNTIQITAPISPGSSGGPVFNMKGEVIGVVSSQMKNGQNLNFAIPANLISAMQTASAELIEELHTPDYSNEIISPDTPPAKPSIASESRCIQQFMETERYEDAVQCFNSTIKTYPSFASGWNCKGAALYYLTRYEEALFCFNKSLELDASIDCYWRNKAAALLKLNRKDEAKIAIYKAIGLEKYANMKRAENGRNFALIDGVKAEADMRFHRI
jgi:serine protease Do